MDSDVVGRPVCAVYCRLLGFAVVLNKSLNGKNGLEDDLDISLCLGNAKIDYRFVSTARGRGCGWADPIA